MSVLPRKFCECLSSNPGRSERKKAAILDAAVAEFLAQGFRDTSMDRIAETANVSKRTVYNHFDSKEDLFRAIVHELLDEQGSSTTTVYDGKRSLEEQLLELVHQDVQLLQDDLFIGMARVLLAESFSSPDLARNAFGDTANHEHALSRWVKAASADGRLAIDDPALATMQLKSLLKGVLFWPLVIGYGERPTKKKVNAIVESGVRMFLGHYGQ